MGACFNGYSVRLLGTLDVDSHQIRVDVISDEWRQCRTISEHQVGVEHRAVVDFGAYFAHNNLIRQS